MAPRLRVVASVLVAAVVSGGRFGTGHAWAAPAAERAAQDWKREFEDICSKTQDAMALSTDELKSLVVRCDAVKPLIDGLDESTRKVYSRRLKACRDLYQFVIDYRQQQGNG